MDFAKVSKPRHLIIYVCSALSAAIEGGGEVFPVFVLDPHFIHSGCVAPARMTFLFDTLADLHTSLQRRSSSLFCLRGAPEDVLPQLFKQWEITRLAYEHDIEPYAKKRDARVAEIAARHGVEVVVRCGAACAMSVSQRDFVSEVWAHAVCS